LKALDQWLLSVCAFFTMGL